MSTENELPDSNVPIYDRAYGIDLKVRNSSGEAGEGVCCVVTRWTVRWVEG